MYGYSKIHVSVFSEFSAPSEFSNPLLFVRFQGRTWPAEKTRTPAASSLTHVVLVLTRIEVFAGFRRFTEDLTQRGQIATKNVKTPNKPEIIISAKKGF